MPRREIDVVLSDVDGTQIIHGQSLPSPAVQAAARGLRANRIPLLEVTSRSHALLRKLVEPLDLRGNLCTLDGGATVARANDGNVLWSRWMNAETTRAVVTCIGELCTQIHFDADSRSRKPKQVLAAVEAGRMVLESAPSVFAVFGSKNGKKILEILGELPNIRHTPIMNYEDSPSLRCIQVVDTAVDKQYGIVQMLRLAKLTNRRALAIGDGMNDLSLFAAVGAQGVKVAMGNAPKELKELADWVAPSVEDDGFAVAMRHYGLVS